MKKLIITSCALLILSSCEKAEMDNDVILSKTEVVYNINPNAKRHHVTTTTLGSEFDLAAKQNNKLTKSSTSVLLKGDDLSSDWQDLSKSTLENMEDEFGIKRFTELDFLKNRFTATGRFNSRPKSVFVNDIRFGKKSKANKARQFSTSDRETDFRAVGEIKEYLTVNNSPSRRVSGHPIFSKKNTSNNTKNLTINNKWSLSETTSKSVSVANKFKAEFEAGGKLLEKVDLKLKFEYSRTTTNTTSTATSRGFDISASNFEINTPPGKTAFWALKKLTRTENYIWEGKFDFTGYAIGDFGKKRYAKVKAKDFFYEFSKNMEIPTYIDFDVYEIETWWE